MNKSLLTRNYTPSEITSLNNYIANHSGSLGTLVDNLSNAGIPLQDIATLTKSALGGTGAGVAGMAASMPTGAGVAPTQKPYIPPTPSQGALAGLASQMPSRMPSNAQYMNDRMSREQIDQIMRDDAIPMPKPYAGTFDMPKPYAGTFDDPSAGYQNPGSSASQMARDLYPPKQPIVRSGDGYPPQQPLPTTGGYSGPGGMFPSQGGDLDYPTPIIPSLPPSEYMVDPSRLDPVVPEPMPYRSHPYDHGYDVDPMMPPRMYEDYERPMPNDPLGALMGQIQNDRVPRDQPIPIGEAMKRGGAVEISQHPTLVRMALGNRR